MVRAQALHRPARVSVVAMPGGQVVVRDGRRGGRRPRRRVRAVEADINYDPDHYGQALEGEAGLADADIAEAAAALTRAARLARRGVMGAVAEGSPRIRAQANLPRSGVTEMAASLPDYVRWRGRSGLRLRPRRR